MKLLLKSLYWLILRIKKSQYQVELNLGANDVDVKITPLDGAFLNEDIKDLYMSRLWDCKLVFEESGMYAIATLKKDIEMEEVEDVREQGIVLDPADELECEVLK